MDFCSPLAAEYATDEIVVRSAEEQERFLVGSYGSAERTLAGKIFEKMFVNYVQECFNENQSVKFDMKYLVDGAKEIVVEQFICELKLTLLA